MPRTLGTVGVLAATTLLAAGLAGPVAADAGSMQGQGQGHARGHVAPHWHHTRVGSDQELRGLDAINRRVAWVSGDAGGVWRTTDGGRHWRDVAPPHSQKLLFRDVEATDRRHALLLAIGPKTASRIYRTSNGGRTWTKTFVNHDKRAFYDCMAMWPGGRVGLAVSDPVNDKFRVIRTTDGGRHWTVLPRRGMPRAKGEFGFAASGTCLVTAGLRRAWIASGGARSRVFRTTDRGRTWHVSPSTIPAAAAGGTFGLSFRGPRHGLAVGGDYTKPTRGRNASAYTTDGGRRWHNGGNLGGYRSGVDWVTGRPGMAVAVGTSGSDLSRDGGRTWHTFRGGYDSVQCVRGGVCWASGAHGRVGRLFE
jgi:photosystem II stability/assembly factor-like uncharacterized protein